MCIPSTRLIREVLFPGLPRGVGFGDSPLPSQPLPQDVSEGCWKRLPTLCVNRAAPPREVIFPCVFRQGRLCWKTSIQALPWWIFLRLEVGKLLGFDFGKAASPGDGCEGLGEVLEPEPGSGLAQTLIKAGKRTQGSAGVLQGCFSRSGLLPERVLHPEWHCRRLIRAVSSSIKAVLPGAASAACDGVGKSRSEFLLNSLASPDQSRAGVTHPRENCGSCRATCRNQGSSLQEFAVSGAALDCVLSPISMAIFKYLSLVAELPLQHP